MSTKSISVRRKAITGVAATLLALGLMAATVDVHAALISYSNPFDKYGQVENTTCPAAPGGICAAVASINSFVYLKRSLFYQLTSHLKADFLYLPRISSFSNSNESIVIKPAFFPFHLIGHWS